MAKSLRMLMAYLVLAICSLDSVATAAVPEMPVVLASVFGQVVQPPNTSVERSLPEFSTPQPDEPGTERAAPLPPGILPPHDEEPIGPQPASPQQSLSALLASNQNSYRNDSLYWTPNMFGDFFAARPVLARSLGGHVDVTCLPDPAWEIVSEVTPRFTATSEYYVRPTTSSNPLVLNPTVYRGNTAFVFIGYGQGPCGLAEGIVFSSWLDIAASPSGPNSPTGTTKIAENGSPLPRNRILFDYAFYNNVPLTIDGMDVNRFAAGFEMMLLPDIASLEMKLPMVSTLDNSITEGGWTDLSNAEFGNLAVTPKVLLMQTPTCALSTGLTLAVPTADSINVVLPNGTPVANIANESVHLMPFVGWLWKPNSRLYAQGFLQYDVAANGNPVYTNRSLYPDGLQRSGTLQDSTYQYVDVAVGYWLHRARNANELIQGLAVTSEIHWNSSLQEEDFVQDGFITVGSPSVERTDQVNLTLGAHLPLSSQTTVSASYSVPLGNRADQSFDGEFRVMVNRWFGPSG